MGTSNGEALGLLVIISEEESPPRCRRSGMGSQGAKSMVPDGD